MYSEAYQIPFRDLLPLQQALISRDPTALSACPLPGLPPIVFRPQFSGGIQECFSSSPGFHGAVVSSLRSAPVFSLQTVSEEYRWFRDSPIYQPLQDRAPLPTWYQCYQTPSTRRPSRLRQSAVRLSRPVLYNRLPFQTPPRFLSLSLSLPLLLPFPFLFRRHPLLLSLQLQE